jgi:hypothetical protein
MERERSPASNPLINKSALGAASAYIVPRAEERTAQLASAFTDFEGHQHVPSSGPKALALAPFADSAGSGEHIGCRADSFFLPQGNNVPRYVTFPT